MNLNTQKLCERLKEKNLDGLIVSSEANISYLSGFKSRDSYAIISGKENIYITDSRYTQEVKKKLRGFKLIEVNGSVFKLISDCCNRLKLNRVGFEERYASFAEYHKIKEGLKTFVELVPTYSLVETLRMVKSEEELKKIKKAVQITVKAFDFIKEIISPGKAEVEIAAELERFIRYNGASYAAFEIIVASGPNSSFPHHLTSARKIKKNEPVLIDMGVDYSGYKSDLTRVFFSGKLNSFEKKVYDIVLKAQNLAINNIKPSINISVLDTLARQYIAKQGYDKFFCHNLGHGIGLEVHEGPHITKKENSKLAPGMVFSVEPGIYLPGKFGIRIEDLVLVTRKGVEVISGSLNK